MISLSNLSMRFGQQVLFEGVTWQLKPGAHYGLVGANGTGKSTLLKVMEGTQAPEGGAVSRPNALKLGTLGQDHFKYDGLSLLDVVLHGQPRLWEALREKAHLLAKQHEHGELSAKEGAHLGTLEAEIADLGGYDAEARAGALLEGLGLPTARHGRPMKELSGGYRLRVLLGQTLFAAPDLLLLDEPTNHLDLPSIRWLEEHLRGFRGTIVVVSHDRHFLNAVCTHIADIDYRELTVYTGNYDAFVAAKELASVQRDTEAERTEAKIAEMQQFVDRFKAKATKARQAQSRKKQIEKMDVPEIKRTSRQYPVFRFTPKRPSGKEVLQIQGVTKSYGNTPVLRPVSLTVERGEKIAVIGPNGVGKTTLLKIITGALAADAGKVVPGYEVHTGYFAQDHREMLKGEATLYDWLFGQSTQESVSNLRGLLGQVLFTGDDQLKRVGSLSGGESARLLLAALMMSHANLLVLDEPTNHLDLEGREALMDALRDYEGTLLVVSHDRHFVGAVAERLWVLSPEGVEDFHGTYDAYLAKLGEDFLSRERIARGAVRNGAGNGNSTPTVAALTNEQRKERKREAGRLRKQVQQLEGKISTLEARIAEIDELFAQPGFYDNTPWEEVSAAEERRREAQSRLQHVMTDWEKAAGQLEGLGEAG